MNPTRTDRSCARRVPDAFPRGQRNGRPGLRAPAALAEERNSGQIIARGAAFIAATYNGQAFPLDLFELRAVDIAISDDMLRAWMRCAGAVPTCTRWSRTATRVSGP